MITLYQIGPGGYWTGFTQEQPDDQVVPSGWTARPVPADRPAGQHAVLTLEGWQFTDVAPPVYQAQQSPVRPLTWADADLDPRYWWIDVGPFFDRFGLKALAITSSTDAQVQGVVQLCMPRQYIDLKRPDIPAMVSILVAKGLITEAEKAAVLTAHTIDYERHVKGLPQPEAAP